MHKDMHYAGTYALAKLAGLSDTTAMKIGTSAQFVDDSGEDIAILDEKTGNLYASEVSVRYSDPKKYLLGGQRTFMLNHIDQLNIWVPFHFLPGNKGKELTQKLVCQPNSRIARDMIASHLKKAKALASSRKGHEWGPYLIGVAAHVYADTFAHYGFSGVSSRRNLVDATSIRTYDAPKKEGDRFWQKAVVAFRDKWGYSFPNIRDIITNIGGELSTKTKMGTMGHPGVGSMPDMPYLSYHFQYEHTNLLEGGQPTKPRNNQKDYMACCEKLHQYFCRYREQVGEKMDKSSYRDFAQVRGEIAEILAFRKPKAEHRLAHWHKKAREFWGIKIPEYGGEQWLKDFRAQTSSGKIKSTHAYRFFMAAAWHKKTVLDGILPKHGINIECRQFRIDSGGF